MEDLREEREKVEKSLQRTKRYYYVGAEYFGSRPTPSKEECMSEVIESDVYVGIFGYRYGNIPEGEEKSITELEYRKAKGTGRPCLIYFKAESSASVALDEAPIKVEKLRELKAELKRDYQISWFDSPSDLAVKIVADLSNLEKQQAIQPHWRLQVTAGIQKFKEDRISDIIAGKSPIRLYDDHKVILHLIPFRSCDGAQKFKLTILAEDRDDLQPFSNFTARPPRPNVDGLVSATSPDELSEAYVQVFRNGIIESVDSQSFIGAIPGHGDARFLWINEFEACCINALERYLRIFDKLGVGAPVYIFLTLVSVSGVQLLDTDASFPLTYRARKVAIDRDLLPVPEVVIESFDKRPDAILKDVFDSVWQACGHYKSLNYKEDGSYTNKQRCL